MMEFGYAPVIQNLSGVFCDPKYSLGRVVVSFHGPMKSTCITETEMVNPTQAGGHESVKCSLPACESGWTTYLDQSRILEEDGGAVSAEEEEEELREDPSMASDASSGPEQPGCRRRKRNADCWESSRSKALKDMRLTAREEEEEEMEDDLDDTCQSNLSCESVSDDPRSARRQWSKRRKVAETSLTVNHSASACCSEIGDGHSDENDVEVESEETEICSRPNINDAVHTRLEALQELIPNTRKLDGEQVLEVAIDYVKSLETKIKMFEAAQNNKSFLSHETFPSLSSNALQDKGLCLFPLSMVAS